MQCFHICNVKTLLHIATWYSCQNLNSSARQRLNGCLQESKIISMCWLSARSRRLVIEKLFCYTATSQRQPNWLWAAIPYSLLFVFTVPTGLSLRPMSQILASFLQGHQVLAHPPWHQHPLHPLGATFTLAAGAVPIISKAICFSPRHARHPSSKCLKERKTNDIYQCSCPLSPWELRGPKAPL